MKPSRLEDLYNRSLVPPEESKKVLPLEHILKKELVFFPKKPTDYNFDIVEIGPGTGDFLFHLAQQNPSKKILGIEIGNKRFNRISERLIKREITNITLIGGDARIPFHKQLIDNSLEKCFVLFPDPWPKNKHAHLRLLQTDFLNLIAQKLKSGGELTLGTDVKDYANWVFNNLLSVSNMKNSLDPQKISQHLDDIIPTYFKKKWEKMGREFWFLRFHKI